MQIPIVSGIYSDAAGDFRTSLPRNMVPVPKQQGISNGYLRPAEGVELLGVGPGGDRGGINWGGVLYRVMGAKLCRVDAAGSVTVLGDIGGSGPVSMDYSFDRLGIASGGNLWYWDGSTLTQVTDPDVGAVLDVHWIAGYFMTTDGAHIITTDLADPASVNVLHYGSAEADPDPVQAVDELRNEAYALGRYTVEVYQNIGGDGFPFQRIESAQITKGCIGRAAYCALGNAFAFCGGGRGEAPAVYLTAPGDAIKISTREVDTILRGYTETELSGIVMETRVDKNHQHVLLHLPDRCLVYDTIGSQAMEQPIWFQLDSGTDAPAQYRARGLVWCYDQWNVADPVTGQLGRLTDAVSTHYGDAIGWGFSTGVLYNEGAGGIIHELELVTLPGRVALGADPVIWTSYSEDGIKWSQERPARAGKQGQATKRIVWRTQGVLRHMRMQRFRGRSDCRISVARLEAQVEPLFTKAGSYG